MDFQCAIRPKGDGGFYINLATQLRREARIVLGQPLVATLSRDDSTYGRDLPEELSELLALDDEGSALFQKLLPSHQRGIIHYVASAKSVQVRIDRAIKMINGLKTGVRHDG